MSNVRKKLSKMKRYETISYEEYQQLYTPEQRARVKAEAARLESLMGLRKKVGVMTVSLTSWPACGSAPRGRRQSPR